MDNLSLNPNPGNNYVKHLFDHPFCFQDHISDTQKVMQVVFHVFTFCIPLICYHAARLCYDGFRWAVTLLSPKTPNNSSISTPSPQPQPSPRSSSHNGNPSTLQTTSSPRTPPITDQDPNNNNFTSSSSPQSSPPSPPLSPHTSTTSHDSIANNSTSPPSPRPSPRSNYHNNSPADESDNEKQPSSANKDDLEDGEESSSSSNETDHSDSGLDNEDHESYASGSESEDNSTTNAQKPDPSTLIHVIDLAPEGGDNPTSTSSCSSHPELHQKIDQLIPSLLPSSSTASSTPPPSPPVSRPVPPAPAPTAITTPAISDEQLSRLRTLLQDNEEFQTLLPREQLLLIELLDLTINCQQMEAFDPNRRALKNQIEEKKRVFVEHPVSMENIPLSVDEFGDPQILDDILTIAQNAVQASKFEKKKELIAGCCSDINFSLLTLGEIETLYQTCLTHKQLATSVEKQFSDFIALATIPEDEKAAYKVTVQYTFDGQDEERFALVTPDNFLLSYSIYEVLRNIHICSDTNYAGETVFLLKIDELKKLKEHIKEGNIWKEECTAIFSGLLGEAAQEYISVAQKPKSEIVKPNGHGRMTEEVAQTQLIACPYTVCLLFTQISINLTACATDRDFVKKNMEKFYKTEGLLANNKQPKEFLHDDPYRSILNAGQINKISPHLNMLVQQYKLLKDFLQPDQPPLTRAFTIVTTLMDTSALGIIAAYRVGHLTDMRNILRKNPDAEFVQHTKLMLGSLDIPTLEKRSTKAYHFFLQHNMAPYFKIKPPIYEPSKEEITQLYAGYEMQLYRGQIRHKNIEALCTALRDSDACRGIFTDTPGLEDNITGLQDMLIGRLNEYHGLGNDRYYGQAMVDQAIEFLEQYVAKIVYRDKSKVTTASIERSLNELAALLAVDRSANGGTDRELDHCSRGLAGRTQSLLTALTQSIDDAFLDHMNEFMKSSLGDAFAAFSAAGHGLREGSMMIEHKGTVALILGINPTTRGSYDTQPLSAIDGHSMEILQFFCQLYTPATIYESAHTFFCNKFWELNQEPGEEMYRLFGDLGFSGDREQLDKEFRVGGDADNKWQYAFFQQALPHHLIPYLQKKQFLSVKQRESPEMVIEKAGNNRQHTIGKPREMTAEQQRILEAARSSSSQGLPVNDNIPLGFEPRSQMPAANPSTG